MRWRIQTKGVTPEEAGLCGCWQFVAVWRERQELRRGKVVDESEEYSFYATSAALGSVYRPAVVADHSRPLVCLRKRGPLSAGCEPG